MDFHILGPLEVRDDRGEISIGGGKQRALLALLLIHPNESLATDRLIDELWGEEPPPTAAKIIQNHVSQLRRVLGDDRLQTQARGYALRVGPGELDVDRFRQRFADGRRAQAAGDPERASLLLREALAMWRGPPLAEFTYEAFAQHEIGRLEELRLSALIERIDADLALGRHVDLVAELETLVAEHPLQERLRGQLMLALYRCGRQAEALQVYQDADGRSSRSWGSSLASRCSAWNSRSSLTTRLSSGRPPNGHARRQALGRGRGVGRQCSATSGCSSSSSPRQLSSPSLPPRSSPGAITPCRGRPSRATRSRASTPARIGSRARSRVGVAPAALALGNGSLWVANTVDQSVSRIDLASRKVVHAVPVGGVPVSLAVGRNGVWVVRRRSDGFPELIKIDPALRRRGAGSAGAARRAVGSAASVAAGADAVWVAAEAGSLERLDPGGKAITASIDTGNSPTSVAVGAGAVWVGDARRQQRRPHRSRHEAGDRDDHGRRRARTRWRSAQGRCG